MRFINSIFSIFNDGGDVQTVLDEQLKKLKDATYENTKEFKFNGNEMWAKCVKVYDGDTAHFALCIEGEIYRFRVRFAGIDTAELRSVDSDPYIREQEIKHAENAKDRVVNLIEGELVFLHCIERQTDKYQRILAKVYLSPYDKKSINDLLVEEGLAYYYDGNKRKNFRSWYLGMPDVKHNIDSNIQDSEVL